MQMRQNWPWFGNESEATEFCLEIIQYSLLYQNTGRHSCLRPPHGKVPSSRCVDICKQPPLPLAAVHTQTWHDSSIAGPEFIRYHGRSIQNTPPVLRICLSHLPHQLASYHNSITALQQRIACVRACSAPLPMRPGTGRVRKKSVRPRSFVLQLKSRGMISSTDSPI